MYKLKVLTCLVQAYICPAVHLNWGCTATFSYLYTYSLTAEKSLLFCLWLIYFLLLWNKDKDNWNQNAVLEITLLHGLWGKVPLGVFGNCWKLRLLQGCINESPMPVLLKRSNTTSGFPRANSGQICALPFLLCLHIGTDYFGKLSSP